jgi:hypothetical protein
MIELFEKRGKWCYRDANGKIHKFATKEEAMYLGLGVEPEESEESCACEDCDCDPCECEEYAAILKELEEEEGKE